MSSDKEHETTYQYLVGLCEMIESEQMQDYNDFAPVNKSDFKSMKNEELLARLQDAIQKLLNFKQMICVTDIYEVASEAEKLENCMQEREADIRKHLQSQYQLRVTLQDRKWDLEKLESNEDQQKSIQNKLEEKLNYLKIPKFRDETKVKQEMEKKIQELQKTIQGKEEKIGNITKDNGRLKEQLEERAAELVILKKEKKRMDNVVHLMKRSPDSVDSEDLQPGLECSIFLSPLLEKVEKKKDQLKPRHKRASTGGEFDLKSTVDSLFVPEPVFIKQEVTLAKPVPDKPFRRSLFHSRAYNKVAVG